jgi:hypothetical protein
MSVPSSHSGGDLNQLISGLSVTRTNRARIREQGGEGDREGSNNADGTSFHLHDSVGTGLGQPHTVNSNQGLPRSINVEVQPSSPSRMVRNQIHLTSLESVARPSGRVIRFVLYPIVASVIKEMMEPLPC